MDFSMIFAKLKVDIRQTEAKTLEKFSGTK